MGNAKKRSRVGTPPAAVSPKWSLKPRCKRAARQPWAPDEDKRLREAVKQLGKARNWRTIAENFVKTRNASQCSQRWHKTVRPELQHVKRGTWSEDEDAKLRQLVKEHTSIHGGNLLGIWNGISRDMGFGRNPKQCRERWTHFLDPSLKIGEWSMEEDHKLMKMYDEQGRKMVCNRQGTAWPNGRTSQASRGITSPRSCPATKMEATATIVYSSTILT